MKKKLSQIGADPPSTGDRPGPSTPSPEPRVPVAPFPGLPPGRQGTARTGRAEPRSRSGAGPGAAWAGQPPASGRPGPGERQRWIPPGPVPGPGGARTWRPKRAFRPGARQAPFWAPFRGLLGPRHRLRHPKKSQIAGLTAIGACRGSERQICFITKNGSFGFAQLIPLV